MPAFYSKYTVRCISPYYILLGLSFKRCCSSIFQFSAAWIWTKMLYHLPWAINSAQKCGGRNTKSFFGYKQKQRLTWHRWVGINTRWRFKMAGPLKKSHWHFSEFWVFLPIEINSDQNSVFGEDTVRFYHVHVRLPVCFRTCISLEEWLNEFYIYYVPRNDSDLSDKFS